MYTCVRYKLQDIIGEIRSEAKTRTIFRTKLKEKRKNYRSVYLIARVAVIVVFSFEFAKGPAARLLGPVFLMPF